LLAAKKPPYNVYAAPFYDYAGFGNAFGVDGSGGLKDNVQNYEYSPLSAVHGMVFDPSESFLYSADMWANRIWCHRKDECGLLTVVGSIEAPKEGDHPRWAAMHPTGKHLYVLMEAGNTVATYSIDEDTHMPVYTTASYPLVPPSEKLDCHVTALLTGLDLYQRNPKRYRADVVEVSHSGKYLFATSRSNSPAHTGYISAFSLDEEGQICDQLCLNPTPTSGGHSNAISPCDWSDEWLALTDDEKGWIEVYQWDGKLLSRVAHCDVKEPGFGMNAIWYD
jgi:carboxy-cis,cis-muconate cyclase